MSAYRIPMAAGILMAALCPASGRTQETRSPLPYIAAPSNTGSSSASGDAPIVEQPPARLRSGPPRLACWARPSNTKAYVGYYLGGGSVFSCLSQPRFAAEGTWAWDYQGCWLRRCICLQWWHGCSQGGAGAYRVDGPNFFKFLKEKHKAESTPP